MSEFSVFKGPGQTQVIPNISVNPTEIFNVTAGTAKASSPVVLNSSKGISSLGAVSADTVVGRKVVTAYTADGAIAISDGVKTIGKSSAAAMTVAAPTAAQEGTIMRIIAKTGYAHVITFTGNTLDDGTSATKLKATTAAYVGANITVVAINLRWVLLSNVACTLAAS